MENCAYWLADECSNLNMGGSGLSATLRDYARLGTLMLNEGKIGSKNIFSKEWVDDASALLHETNDQGGGYGYLWWRFKNGTYAAVGIFGQMLYIDPHKNLVIVQIAAWPKAGSNSLSEGRHKFIDAIQQVIN
jgi:CubicO group peptidase (beta-lactamase class C family)